MIKFFPKQLVFAFVLFISVIGFAGCKTPEQITQDQPAVKTTQEIVIKQELEKEERILEVTGIGKVDVTPDVAIVELSVSVHEQTAEGAQQKNSELMSAVLKAIQSLGVRDEHMKTQDVTIYPLYENEKKQNEITGYNAINTIVLEIQNVEKINDIVSSAMQAGANELHYIEFQLLDETSAYQEALAAAVENAQMKADMIAKRANIDIDGPKLIRENTDILKTDYDFVQQAGDSNDNVPAIAMPLQAGQITVTAEVVVEFSIIYPSKAETVEP